MCDDCEEWNHVYCVDKLNWYASTYNGNCVFCEQMKKSPENQGEKIEVKMNKKQLDFEEPEPGPDVPSGRTKEWEFYFNLYKYSYNVKVGDVVYARIHDDEKDPFRLWWIAYLVIDKKGKKYIAANEVLFPNQIVTGRFGHNRCFSEKFEGATQASLKLNTKHNNYPHKQLNRLNHLIKVSLEFLIQFK